jgi:hypothetical protein
MSSMQSAPAHIPATTVASFGAGFADPDLILGAPIWTFSPSSRRSPVDSAKRHHRHQRAPICPSRLGGFIPAA